MSQVQLQVRPRRARSSAPSSPPPFQFRAAAAPRRAGGSIAEQIWQLPVRVAARGLRATGRAIDAAFFLFLITIWCALHLTVWSYAFDMGPAASCFGLPCPSWLRSRVFMACGGLAVLSFVISMVLRKLGHNATAMVLVMLVTLDVAGVLLLGIRSLS